MIVLVSGAKVATKLGSIDIDDSIGQRSTASFVVVDKTGEKRYKKGQVVEIYQGTNNVNLVPPFSKWNLHPNVVLNSDYDVTLNASAAWQTSDSPLVDVEIGKSYHISFPLLYNNSYVEILRQDNSSIVFQYASTGFTFVPDTDKIIVRFGTNFAGNGYPFKNFMLVKGTSSVPFEPREKLFSGVIDRPVSMMGAVSGAVVKFHKVTCSDNTFYCDKRLVARSFESVSCGSIVNTLLTSYLSAEGISVGQIQDGPIAIAVAFNYATVTKCLDSLAERAGFEWWIDCDKKLHFVDRETYISDTIIFNSSPIRNVQVEEYAEQYRNKQYIRAGKDQTDLQTEKFIADGVQKTFNVGYGIAKEPIIKVGGVAKNVGVKGLHTGQDWYFSRADNTITQDQEASPISAGTEIEVQYIGLFDIVAITYDTDEIERRKSLEGGTGIHEIADDDQSIDTREAAFEVANAKLKRYGKISRKVTFDTELSGMRAGQLITLNLPEFDIDGIHFLIDTVRANEMMTHDNRTTYQVSCIEGFNQGGWSKFFKNMANRGQAFVIRENIREDEVLVLLDTFSKTWTQAERPNIFANIVPSNTLFPSTTQYPMFSADQRMLYIQLYDASGNVLIRKKFTKQEEQNNGTTLKSIFYLNPFDVNNIQITEIAFFGGVKATDEIDSGVMLQRMPYSKLKTSVESTQIDRVDTKGW